MISTQIKIRCSVHHLLPSGWWSLDWNGFFDDWDVLNVCLCSTRLSSKPNISTRETWSMRLFTWKRYYHLGSLVISSTQQHVVFLGRFLFISEDLRNQYSCYINCHCHSFLQVYTFTLHMRLPHHHRTRNKVYLKFKLLEKKMFIHFTLQCIFSMKIEHD